MPNQNLKIKNKKMHGTQVHGARVPFKLHGTYKNKKLHGNATIRL